MWTTAALAEYLCERFEQEKIYLVGESWGSALGVWMAQQRPDCSMRRGTGQMVAFLETEHSAILDADREERGDATSSGSWKRSRRLIMAAASR